MISPEGKDSLGGEIRVFEVQIMALRREREDLLRKENGRPTWFRGLRALAVVLQWLLWLLFFASILVLIPHALLMAGIWRMGPG